MGQKLVRYCLVFFVLLSGCSAPAAGATEKLPPKSTPSDVATPQPTLAPSETETLAPEPTRTVTDTPRPTPIFPKACGRVTLGKPGTQSQDKILPVLIEGTAILCNDAYRPEENEQITSFPIPQARLDLDTGLTGNELADIWFFIGCGSMCFVDFFSDDHAATVDWYSDDAREPTYDECKNLSKSPNTENEPQYVCVITNAGHVARIKVEQYYPVEHVSSMKISFITWDVIVNTATPTP